MGQKQSIEQLAIFGGRPLFSQKVSIGQLHVPDVSKFLSHLKKWRQDSTTSFESVQKLEKKLAKYHNVNHCITVANAGFGLILLMSILGGKRQGNVVLPAFTFRGLPFFARWAGLSVRFADISPDTYTLDPISLSKRIDDDTRLILAVPTPMAPGDVTGLTTVAQHHCLPLIFDSVYSLASTYQGAPMGGFGDAEVFSLHATKLLNGFEGGYITTNNPELAEKIRKAIGDSKGAFSLCVPHAEMALCSLENLNEVIHENRQRYQYYGECLNKVNGIRLVPYLNSDRERRGFELIVAQILDDFGVNRDILRMILVSEGCSINPYYAPPLHKAFPDGGCDEDLPCTEQMARCLIQLPGGNQVSNDNIDAIVNIITFVQTHANEIRVALASKDDGGLREYGG